MATGDMKNNIKQLQSELKAVKFTHNVEINGLLSGSPQTYLGIYHHLFTTYSTRLNNDISSSNNELYGKSDMRFMEAVYKILRDMFDYKPLINREQFFSPGYAERKVIMATEIMRLVRSRYKPPKSSTFRITAVKDEPKVSLVEKVQQEPQDRPRKVASKSSPIVEGAIVLPSRSVGRGFKIPKTSIPHPKLSSEGSYFVGEAAASFSRDNKYSTDRDDDDDEEYIEEIRAASPDHSLQEPVKQKQSVVVVNHNSAEALVKRKFLDLVSPALLKVNERIGKLEIGLMNLDKREQQSKVTADHPSSTALTTGLTKQMNDVIFKLDTLVSRVVLIENRLTMIEVKLDSDDKNKLTITKTPGNQFSLNAVLPTQHERPVKNTVVSTQHERPVRNTVVPTQHERPVKNDRNNNSMSNKSGEKLLKADISVHKDGAEDDVSQDESDETKDDLKVVVIREDKNDKITPFSDMAFIKSLVNQNDLENTLVTDISASDTSVRRDSQEMQSKLPKSGRSIVPTLDDMVSPIRPYTNSYTQDESMVGFSYEAGDVSSQDDRRSSTPTHFTLDTSTMDRVSRINQMMAETKQLLH